MPYVESMLLLHCFWGDDSDVMHRFNFFKLQWQTAAAAGVFMAGVDFWTWSGTAHVILHPTIKFWKSVNLPQYFWMLVASVFLFNCGMQLHCITSDIFC